ncbi:hypothetical protein WBP07_13285 [Novosphingobium sp. BL-8A]|uniref:hypothetical protein n=1 Tax=Novosphingobium sp. BL-8A TaxID=3127639 RepID=UPI003757B875
MKQFLTAFQACFVAAVLVCPGQGRAQDVAGLPGSTDSVIAPGPASDAGLDAGAMTGAYFMRDTLVPRADDVALIQRKPALYLSSFNDGMATVAYSLEGRRIVYRVVSGTVNAAARDAIDRALAKLQRKVA